MINIVPILLDREAKIKINASSQSSKYTLAKILPNRSLYPLDHLQTIRNAWTMLNIPGS